MRSRCSTAALAFAILAGGGTVTASAAPDDFFSDGHAPVATRSAALDARPDRRVAQSTMPSGGIATLTPRDWAPEHALDRTPSAAATPAAAPKSAAPPPPVTVKHDDRIGDPEPDEAVKVPAPAPSHDPLDHPPPDHADKTTPAAGTPSGGPVPAQDAKSTLSPVEASIKAALDKRAAAEIEGAHAGERRKERDAIAFFYAARSFAPVWSTDGKAIAAAEPLIARLGRAGDDALTIAVPPVGLKTQGATADVAESEIELTEAVVSYARQATGSRVDPASISPLIGARPDLADPGQVLDQLAAAGTAAGDRLQALNPTEPRYVALRRKLIELHAARPSAELPIPLGPTLRVGMRDPRVPLIRSRFSLDGVAAESADLEYDTQVAEAVAGFQRANGLPPSGNLTRRTIAALSVDMSSRLEGTLVANMEMWRWMPRDLGTNRIEVNVPEFVVTVFHDGDPVQRNRVVVGKTDTPTPIFSKTMKYLIVNPVWNVPESIIKKEFLPKSGGDPSYIAAHGFDVSYRNGRLVVKQPSGAKNALGRIKFMFPNDYSVYLHDTPSKSLFAAAKRAFSHGCVRVDQPFEFARVVLNDSVPEGGDVIWSEKRLMSLLGDKERYVNLPQALPIHIEYFTATVDPETGRLQLRDDVYDYARKVAAALGQDG